MIVTLFLEKKASDYVSNFAEHKKASNLFSLDFSVSRLVTMSCRALKARTLD